MERPLVSVVIPVYNAVAYLGAAVRSVVDQTHRPLEILLVDNLSDDGSAGLIAELHRAHPDLITPLSCTVRGCNPTRNVGLAAARGEWVQFLDADDWLDPGKISDQLALPGRDRADWIIAPYRNHFTDGTTWDNLPHPDPWRGLVYRYRVGYTCSNLFRRSTLVQWGGWNEAVVDGADPELHFRWLKKGATYIFCPEVATHYRHHTAPHRVSTGRPVAGNVQRAHLLHSVNEHLRHNRPEYWHQHGDYFRAALLRALRILATHDLEAAARLHQRWLAKDHPPFGGYRELVALHWQILHQTIGFKTTEKMRLTTKRLLPKRP